MEKHVWQGHMGGWFAEPTPDGDCTGPWSCKEAAEAAVDGKYELAWQLHKQFRSD